MKESFSLRCQKYIQQRQKLYMFQEEIQAMGLNSQIALTADLLVRPTLNNHLSANSGKGKTSKQQTENCFILFSALD